MTEAVQKIVIADTETTGFNADLDRIVEIGCVILYGRDWEGEHYQWYLNPCRHVGTSVKVHGLTDDFLSDKPKFDEKCEEFLNVVKGSKLVMHNSSFDESFFNSELSRCGLGKITDYCDVVDTLAMAREQFPMQKNSLDALCNRFGVDNQHRSFHGALKDSLLLLHVYLGLTRHQKKLDILEHSSKIQTETYETLDFLAEKTIPLNNIEKQYHEEFIRNILK